MLLKNHGFKTRRFVTIYCLGPHTTRFATEKVRTHYYLCIPRLSVCVLPYQVIYQCALEQDLKIFDAGDKTEVGEKGLTLRYALVYFTATIPSIFPQWRAKGNQCHLMHVHNIMISLTLQGQNITCASHIL